MLFSTEGNLLETLYLGLSFTDENGRFNYCKLNLFKETNLIDEFETNKRLHSAKRQRQTIDFSVKMKTIEFKEEINKHKTQVKVPLPKKSSVIFNKSEKGFNPNTSLKEKIPTKIGKVIEGKGFTKFTCNNSYSNIKEVKDTFYPMLDYYKLNSEFKRTGSAFNNLFIFKRDI
jgi:hypothetical protein